MIFFGGERGGARGVTQKYESCVSFKKELKRIEMKFLRAGLPVKFLNDILKIEREKRRIFNT